VTASIININADVEDTYLKNDQEWIAKIVNEAYKHEKIIIQFNEGPALEEINYKGKKFLEVLKDICTTNGWPLEKFDIRSMNLIQNKESWPVFKSLPLADHFLSVQNRSVKNLPTFEKTFGMFIGRSSWDRLYLASHLYNNHKNISLQTFRNYLNEPTSMINLDLDRFFWMMSVHNTLDKNKIDSLSNLLKNLPLLISDSHEKITNIQWDAGAVDDEILNWYNKIFVDVVCEKMITGQTFFPTEKTARALVTRTPFLIMGPCNYIQNLKKLGFRSFDKFWDESYDFLSGVQRLKSICKIIDDLAELKKNEMCRLYAHMNNVLEHNYENYRNLTHDKIMKTFDG
jgi:hypothetical protein